MKDNKPSKYYLFCDESNTIAKEGQLSSIGGIIANKEQMMIFAEKVKQIKEEILNNNNDIKNILNDEVKYERCQSEIKKKYDIELIKAVFESGIEYRILFYSKQSEKTMVFDIFNDKQLKNTNKLYNFYNLYFLYIKNMFNEKVKFLKTCYFDNRTNVKKSYFITTIQKELNKINNNIKIYEITSEKCMLIQISDLITGALNAYVNQREIQNRYKKEFINEMMEFMFKDNKEAHERFSEKKSDKTDWFWFFKSNAEIRNSTSVDLPQQQIIYPENNNCQEKNDENKPKKTIRTMDYKSLNDEILSHRLSDVIGKYCHLQNEGAGRKKCRCPFHHEKTPSFHLDDNKGLWHCFGCGEGGNIFTFIQKIKGCDFQMAVDELCDIFGIDKKKFITVKNEEEVEKTNNFYKTMDIVALFYRENLKQNQDALDYLHIVRGLDDDVIEEFGFGLADNDIHKIIDFCKDRGISEQNLIDCGIIKNTQYINDFDDKRKYLFFRDRIMIPIHNPLGKIVAFGGRIYKTGDENAKYLNSSENDYFKKGNILFNFNRAKRNLKKDNYLIIVEGYMDAIALYKYGFTTAVAPLGTSITENHLKTILNYCHQPLFLFDSDNAGKKASIRACEMLFSLLNTGIIPKFCTLNGAKDVDEFLKKYTKSDLEKQFQNAYDINMFLLNSKLLSIDATNPNQIAILQKEIAYINNKIKDNILKDNYNTFFSAKFNEIKKNIKANFNKRLSLNKNINFNYTQQLPTIHKDSLDFLEKKIIAVVLSCNNENCNDFLENVLHRFLKINQNIYTNLIENQNQKIITSFCNKYIENYDDLMENTDKKTIFKSLINKWELLKIENSDMSTSLKMEERKKIIENKKRMLMDNE